LDDCRSPRKAELLQPNESFEFDIRADEERAYVVADAEGTTLGCLTVHIADGRGGYRSHSRTSRHARVARRTPLVRLFDRR